MTNRQTCKYESLLSLQNDAANNRFWRSVAANISRNRGSATTQNTGKAPICRCHRANVLTAVLVKEVMAVTTILEVTEVNVLVAIN